MCQPALRGGAVAVRNGKVVAVGHWKNLRREYRGELVDLGEVILMPGLVNAHCHLDYTSMAGQLPPPRVFTDWLKLITETKSGWHIADYRKSWIAGAEMLARTGTTTVADIEAVPSLLPEMWNRTPLRVLSFLEIIGLGVRRQPGEVFSELLATTPSLRHKRCAIGLSPHAPYSTIPTLLELALDAAARKNWRLSTHAAESALEFQMFRHKRGQMFDWLQKSGRCMSDCGIGTPLQHLDRYGLLNGRMLLAHVNYLGRQDARLLGESGTHVVHCPRSHFYFKHAAFPLTRLRRAGVNICLGTDSLASVYIRRKERPVLSMFEEMRQVSGLGTVSPRTIVRMATVNSARALGMTGAIGQISPGAFADFIAIPNAKSGRDINETVVQHRGEVTASMIGGEWVKRPSGVATQPELELGGIS